MFTREASDSRSARRKFAVAARGKGFTTEQLAYGGWKADAVDRPDQAAYYESYIAQLSLNSSDKAAVDSVLSGEGIS